MNIKEAARFLLGKDNILILTHMRPDGDTLCSAGALAYGLNRLGKQAYILPNPEAGDRYLKYVEKFYAPADFKPDCVISVDTARETMITKGGESYADRGELAIDHHGSNSLYAERSCIDGDAAACGEMICDIIRELGVALDPELASLLYIAISTDTGCFVYNNTTSKTLDTAAQLVKAGAPNGRLNKEFFRTKKRGVVLLEGVRSSQIWSSLTTTR
jgi:phosphoesterase RecJ-like protein